MKRIFLFLLLLYYDFESVVLRLVKPKEKAGTLVLRVDNIGDFVLWLNSAAVLRERLSGHITLLCSPAVATIAEKTSFFDEIITVSNKKIVANLSYRFSFMCRLRRKRYDRVLNPIYSRDYFENDSIVRNVCAAEKVGFGRDYHNTEMKMVRCISDKAMRKRVLMSLLRKADKFYTKIIDTDACVKMELKRNAEFVSKLFETNIAATLPKLCFDVPMFGEAKNFIVFFVGASQEKKSFGGENFAYMVDRVSSFVVLCGGETDMETANEIMDKVSMPENVLNLVGKTSLLDLCSVIREALLVVSNDTVAAHLATMMRTKSIVICPGVFWGRFHPYDIDEESLDLKTYFPMVVNFFMDCYGCGGMCKYTKSKTERWPCIGKISPDMVVREITKALGNNE